LTFLLDSDRVIDYLLGQSAATALLQLLESEGLAISEVTFGEIYDGIFHSKDPVAAEIVFQRFPYSRDRFVALSSNLEAIRSHSWLPQKAWPVDS
jgi:predicted nucleic acid-binding protein